MPRQARGLMGQGRMSKSYVAVRNAFEPLARSAGKRLTLIRRRRRMTGNDLEALGVELIAAEEAGEPRRLAALAWQL